MNQLFPYANIVAAILILVIGFGLHWLGQAIGVVNQDLAIKLGIWEKGLPPDSLVYENAIAKADLLIGWTYPLAAIGLILDQPWGYKLAWFPGVVFVYHSISAWFWEANRRKSGHRYWSEAKRVTWCGSNFLAGLLTILVAWDALSMRILN